MTPKIDRGRHGGLTAVRLALVALLVLWAGSAGGAAGQSVPGAFDHYVLALSWSPTYCASPRGHGSRLQCGSARRYDFVVHGLWPQFGDGWPQYCAGQTDRLPEAVIGAMLDIMPSPRLVQHQWTKHGTCTGLAPGEYFALTRRLHDAITIPDRYVHPTSSIAVSVTRMVADFVTSNPGLAPDMVSVRCGNRRDRARLVELRICFSRSGEFRSCGANEQRQCRAAQLVLPPVR